MPPQIAGCPGAAQAVSSAKGAARWTPQRAALVVLIVGAALLSPACWMWNEEDFELNFDNRSDSVLCCYHYPEEAAAARCSAEVKPLAETTWLAECGDGPGARGNRITVILIVKEGGRQIYQRTEECRTWQASHGTFVIEQQGDAFIVTDRLGDTTRSP
jgi:hypothetical protein